MSTTATGDQSEQQDNLIKIIPAIFYKEEEQAENLKDTTYFNEEEDKDFNKEIYESLEDDILSEREKEELETDSLTVNVEQNDGTEKEFIITQPKGEEISPETDNQILELRDYVNKEKENIKEISAKDKNNSNKISLVDYFKKELNTSEYNSNGERMGEKIIMSLLKPFKVLSNYYNQQVQKQNIKPEEKKVENFISINDQVYKLLSYSKDFTEINVEDDNGKKSTINNEKSFSFAVEPKKDFTSLQMELLLKGKTLIEKESKESHPYKVSWKNNKLQFETISTTDFQKNFQKDHRINVEQKITPSLKPSL